MYLLKADATFDSAHFLKGYNGKCANLHGHTWRIEAVISSKELIAEGEKRGMVLDFSDLKRALRGLADRFDHTLIYERGTLSESTLSALRGEGFSLTELPLRPTAENLAKLFFDELKSGLPVKSVTVYETPSNCAVYEEE